MNTREKIVQSTLRNLQTRSYEGFSFQDVADDVGIRKASIYSHFAGKEDLVRTALEQARAHVQQTLEGANHKPARERLLAYIALSRELAAGGDSVCPFGSFAAVLGAVPAGLQSTLDTCIRFQIEWLEATIAEAKRAGDIEDTGHSDRDDAELLLAAIQGAMVTGRLGHDAEIFDRVVERVTGGLFAQASPQRDLFH
ncbi:MAG: TetR/AcrR family transcriptional regulator [Gammaproteobacteria bacterium]|nr:TetR/AcrR family transcriptional regulator [Gammaproteobacteria bacterium]